MDPTDVPGWHGLTSNDIAAELTPAGANFLFIRQTVSLLNAKADAPQLVRITLKPLRRRDSAPTMPRTALNHVAVDGYRAGYYATPAAVIPNPIVTGSKVNGMAHYGLVRWGCGGSKRQGLVCDWPAAGGSIEVVADQVTVEALCGEGVPGIGPGLAVTAAQAGGTPVFSAELAQSMTRGRGQYDPLSFTHQAGGMLNTVAHQFGVPEWATSLHFGLGDALPTNGALRIAFLDGASQVLWESNHGTTGSAQSNLGMPVVIPVPEDAITMTATLLGVGALNTTGWAHWRLAP